MPSSLVQEINNSDALKKFEIKIKELQNIEETLLLQNQDLQTVKKQLDKRELITTSTQMNIFIIFFLGECNFRARALISQMLAC